MRMNNVWRAALACLGLGLVWSTVVAVWDGSAAGAPSAEAVHRSASGESAVSAADVAGDSASIGADRREHLAGDAPADTAKVHFEGDGESPVAVRVVNLTRINDDGRFSAFFAVTNVTGEPLRYVVLRPVHRGRPLLADDRCVRVPCLKSGVGQPIVCQLEAGSPALDPSEIEFEVRLAQAEDAR